MILRNETPINRYGTARDFHENKFSLQCFNWGKYSQAFLSVSTTNILIEISDKFLEECFAEIQNFIFSSRRTWQVAFDATMENADFAIKILSSRCLLVLLLTYHKFQIIQTKHCTDLSSSDIDKQKTQTGVPDATRF